MLNILLKFFNKLNIISSRHILDLLRVLFILVLIISIFAFLFSYYERISIFKAFYWAVETSTTVGYGDVVPVNNIGRLIAIGLMITGIGVLGLFLATISSIMINLKFGRVFGTMESYFYNNHIVILGYSNSIKESLSDILNEENSVTLVADIDKSPIDSSKLIFIRGRIIDESVISKAHIDKAKLCVVSDEDDSNSLIAGVYVRTNYKNTYIVALVNRKEIEKALRDIGINEVFSASSFSSKILARTVSHRGASLFFNQLLDEKFREGLTERDVDRNLIGKNFYDLIGYYKEKKDELPVGIKRGAVLSINPDGKFVINEGDKLILIGKK